MSYISLVSWVDLTDGHEYHATDKFPHDDKKVSDERISALASNNNPTGYPLIAEIVDNTMKETKKKEE